MKLSRGLLSFATAALLAATSSILAIAPATAAAPYRPQDMAAGILVQYQPGSSPFSESGDLRANAAAGVRLSYDSAIGLGWYALDFDRPIDANSAFEIANRVDASDGVLAADVNLILRTTPASTPLKPSTAPVKPTSTLKPATAVLTARAANSFDKANPLIPRIKLSWKAPSNLGGGKLVGYRIEQSDDLGSSWAPLVKNTGSNATVLYVNQNLVVGLKGYFRVRAITSMGVSTKLGAPSGIASATPTTIPQIPVLNFTTASAAKSTITWKRQSLEQRGGLPVTYVVTAKAAGQQPLTCETTGNSCELVGLVSGLSYSLTLIAKNANGSSGERLPFTANDPQIDKQWHLNSTNGINVNAAWKRSNGEANIVVAVIDSGITNHPDLVGQTVPGYDFVSDAATSGDGDGRDADPSDPGDGDARTPSSWHGTHVAGLIAAASNTVGGVGVAPGVKVQMLRALGTDGGESKDLAAAISWAAGIDIPGVPRNVTPARVINMSLGTDSPQRCDAATQSAVEAVKALGVTMVTAAGNTGSDAFWSYPGNCFGTINVGATGFHGDRAWYSNKGLGVDISAPGGDSRNFTGAPEGTSGRIYSTSNDGKLTVGEATYAYQEGTSMAAPILAGVVALMYSVEPTLNFDEVWKILKSTVTPFAPGTVCAQGVGTDFQLCGAGIVNAGAAVEAAIALR